MRAARQFALDLQERDLLAQVARVRVELFGSLALTGHGHQTDRAVLLGLSGEAPETVDPASVYEKVGKIRQAASAPPLELSRNSLPRRTRTCCF